MNILYISTRPPLPVISGDRTILFNRIKEMSERHKISLVYLYQNNDEPFLNKELINYCENIWAFKLPRFLSIFNVLVKSLLSSEPNQVLYYKSNSIMKKIDNIVKDHDFNLINVFLIRGLPYIYNSKVPVILDMIDSMQLNYDRRIQNSNSYFAKKFYNFELNRLIKFEKNLPKNVTKTIVVAEKDSLKISSKNQVIPLAIDTNLFKPTLKKKPNTIIFSGNMSYSPNIEAVKWFMKYCFDDICKQMSNHVTFTIAGANPTREVLNFQSKNVNVSGYVDSLVPIISSSSLAIAPMQSGSGMQNKILEAMSCKTPVLTSLLGLGSIKARHGKEIIVQDTPKLFTRSVVDVLKNPEKYIELEDSARLFVLNNHSWISHADSIDKLYNEALRVKS